MKKILFSAAVAALFFTACKKKDDNSNAGSFSVNGKTYTVNYGYDGITLENGISDGDVAFISHNISELDNDKFSGTYSWIDLGIDSLIDGATYTYLPSYDDNFNKAKNFGWVDLQAGMKVVNGEEVNNDDAVSLTNPTSGTVTVKKSGSRYTFTFELVYSATTTVKGQYTGTLDKLPE